MQRRQFITIIGGAAAWPIAAAAQKSTVPVVGFLGTTAAHEFTDRVAAFREGLKETGYVEGQNVVIEYRWPEGNYDRLPSVGGRLGSVGRWRLYAAVGGEPFTTRGKVRDHNNSHRI